MHVYFSPLFPYFSGLALRTPLYSDGVYSGSLNLQACTWSGNFSRLKDVPTECQEVVTAGWEGNRCGKSKGAMHRAGLWPDTREST